MNLAKGNCILVMGVSGVGKTTIGKLLSQQLSLPFLEADDFHPMTNIEKMSNGMPLNDTDRLPWLSAIGAKGKTLEANGFILACSALKESYREILQNAISHQLFIIFLKGNYDLIARRMLARSTHFMPVHLLKSQFDDLESPQNALVFDVEEPPSDIVHQIIQQLANNQTSNIT